MKHFNKEELKLAANFFAKLSQGIDPLTNTKLLDDTVLNNRKYLQIFSYTEDALRYLINNNIDGRTFNAKPDFHLSDLEKREIKISKDPISVSQIAYNINAMVVASLMRKIKATQITSWLTDLGYLQEDQQGKTLHKVSSERATEIGIHTIKKMNKYNKVYYVSIYNENAQKFIIDNINEIFAKY